MHNENTSKIADDEIDLKSIGKKIYFFIFYPVRLITSHKIISLCFVVAAVLLSISFKYIIPKTYTASFLIKPIDIRDKTYLNVLGDISMLLKKNDDAELAKMLNVDTLVIAKLVNISIENNPADSTHCTKIEMDCTTNTVFLELQKGILNYLENNPYYLKIKSLHQKQIEMNLDQIDKDLLGLDSLKKFQLSAYKSHSNTSLNGFVLNELINPTAAYSVSSDRIQKKSNFMAQATFIDRFQLVKGCVISQRHDWPPRILVMCLVLVPASLVLCALFLHSRSKKTLS